jgi:hypothetical protein
MRRPVAFVISRHLDLLVPESLERTGRGEKPHDHDDHQESCPSALPPEAAPLMAPLARMIRRRRQGVKRGRSGGATRLTVNHDCRSNKNA